MINKVKENNTLYIRRCNHCKSYFSYDIQEWAKDNYCHDKKVVECPYCCNRNKIIFKIKYRSSEKVNQDYKDELDKVKNINENLKSLYKSEKEMREKYHKKYNEENSKVGEVNYYINKYMESPKKNNLATKYLKEIQEIIK